MLYKILITFAFLSPVFSSDMPLDVRQQLVADQLAMHDLVNSTLERPQANSNQAIIEFQRCLLEANMQQEAREWIPELQQINREGNAAKHNW